MRRSAPKSSRRSRVSSPTCVSASKTGSPCWRGFAASSPSLERIRRRFQSKRSPKRSNFWNGSRTTILRFLGARDFAFSDSGDVLEPAFATGLGLLRSREARLLQRWNEPLTMTRRFRAFLEEPKLLIVTKSTVRSPVHRRVQLDYIGVKRFDRSGKLVGEHRFCGLFTSTAYTRPARTIPYLRRKTDSIIRRAGFDPSSHSGKALVNVLETYPRDELFQIDEDTLYQFALAVLQLDERPRVRVLPRRDRFDRFVSVLVYVPRDRYGGQIRAAIGNYLAAAFNGRLERLLPVLPGRAAGARALHYRAVRRRDGKPGSRGARPRRRGRSSAAGRMRCARRSRSVTTRRWGARCSGAIATRSRSITAKSILRRLRSAIFASSKVSRRNIRSASIFTARAAPRRRVRDLKVFSHNRAISLSERVPVLENMGFRVVDERTYHIRPADAAEVWFHDMELESASGQPIDLAALEGRLEACFLVVMGKKAESDGYNALVLTAGLGWRDVALDPDHLALPAPNPRALFARLHVGDVAQISRHCRGDRDASFKPVSIRIYPQRSMNARRARPQSQPQSKPRCSRSRASTKTVSFVISSTRSRRRSAPIFISSAAMGVSKS